MSAVPDIMLNNGRTIPQLGFGVFQIEPGGHRRGRRHGPARSATGTSTPPRCTATRRRSARPSRKSGLDRSEVFVTSKLNNGCPPPRRRPPAFDGSLDALGFDYVDLFLIHWPLPTRYDGDFVSTWKALEEIYRDGRARSIGVSNFQPHHLRRLHEECEIRPAVNQIEVHPYLTQDDVRAFCAEHQIAIEAWSPIAQGGVLDDPTIVSIASRVGKTPGPGRPALAHPARRHRLPEVGHSRPDQGEHRHLRLRTVRRGHRGDQRAEQERAHWTRSGQVRHDPGLGRHARSSARRSSPSAADVEGDGGEPCARPADHNGMVDRG